MFARVSAYLHQNRDFPTWGGGGYPSPNPSQFGKRSSPSNQLWRLLHFPAFVHSSTHALTVWYHRRPFCGFSTQCPSSGKYSIFDGTLSRCSVVNNWKPSETSRR